MNVLVGCEYTGIVTNALRAYNVQAFSCDILETEGNKAWHIKGDLIEVLHNNKWDAVIAFPPCTHLAVSGAKHFYKKKHLQTEALEMVRTILEYDCDYICLENPVGIISTRITKPTQYIQPYEYGNPQSKKTCLWLKGLPKLIPTKNVYNDVEWQYFPSGKRMCKTYSQNKKDRDKTFKGIAYAMANQWHTYLQGKEQPKQLTIPW
tara:strand:+ start:2229 stop:2846 length:618 start_codon:yes stop_codon:yes gene_type:complete